MKTKSIYKIVDGKGRVLIPKEMREVAAWAMEILCG